MILNILILNNIVWFFVIINNFIDWCKNYNPHYGKVKSQSKYSFLILIMNLKIQLWLYYSLLFVQMSHSARFIDIPIFIFYIHQFVVSFVWINQSTNSKIYGLNIILFHCNGIQVDISYIFNIREYPVGILYDYYCHHNEQYWILSIHFDHYPHVCLLLYNHILESITYS